MAITEWGYTRFSSNFHERMDGTYKEKTGNGFADNYRGKGEPALELHGEWDNDKSGQIFYEKGYNIYNIDGSVNLTEIKTDGSVTSAVDAILYHEHIDLKADCRPLRLMACYAAKGGDISSAVSKLYEQNGICLQF